MGKISCDNNELFENTISSELKFHGRVFDCLVKTVVCPDGQESFREIVKHNGGACILPVDKDLNCYMVRQFRSPFEKVLLEVPAGKIEEGEDPLVCASREITEETGFVAGSIEYLGSMAATPGYCSEIIHMYLATDLEFTGGNPDETEFLENVKLPLSELVKMCDEGEIVDAKTMIAIYKAARRFL